MLQMCASEGDRARDSERERESNCVAEVKMHTVLAMQYIPSTKKMGHNIGLLEACVHDIKNFFLQVQWSTEACVHPWKIFQTSKM